MTITQPELRFPKWADENRWERFQRPVYEEIIARFEEGNRLVLLDAPPGAGKSLLAYMTRQTLDAEGYYLVGTKTLQTQIEKSFPDVPLIKGRANYTPTDVETRGTWRDPTCADCDWDFESDICSYCSDRDACPYIVARDDAVQSVLPCTNYSYALGEWSSAKSRFRNRGLVIADECDTIEDELLGFVSISISPRMQKKYKLRPPDKKTKEETWGPWFEYAIPHLGAYIDDLDPDDMHERRERTQLVRLVEKMLDIATDLSQWVYEYEEGFIEFKPITVHQLGNDYFWRNGQRFLCMTASLGSPEQFVADMGYEDSWSVVYSPSTFDVERRPIYVCGFARMSKQEEAEQWPKMADAAISTAQMYPDARMLYHTNSGTLTRYLANAFEDEAMDRPVFWYAKSEEGKVPAIEGFERTPGSILLAPSLDRGYDNSDIDVGVICKVPFPYLGSKQVEKRLYNTRDGRLWFANQALKTLIQAYGRVMRDERDSGICVVLDSVFLEFYSRWKRFFPEHFQDAVHRNSDLRFELRQLIKERERVKRMAARKLETS